jgi:hypothetical protein
MQEVLADLPLRERVELGRQFAAVIERQKGRTEGYCQATAHIDSRPEWIFVFGSSKGWARAGMLRSIEPIMRAALSYYQKEKCMIVIDRDDDGYEVAITRPGHTFTATAEDVMNEKNSSPRCAFRRWHWKDSDLPRWHRIRDSRRQRKARELAETVPALDCQACGALRRGDSHEPPRYCQRLPGAVRAARYGKGEW